MGRAVLRSAVDGHIRKDMPDRAFSTSGLLRVCGSARADQGHAFVWFPRPMPLGAVVTSATLKLHSREPVGGSVTVAAHRVTEQFVVSEATWNNQPGVLAGSRTVTRPSVPWNAPWEIDVTPDMQAVAAGTAWWGWRISTLTASAQLRMYSANSGSDLRPELTVEWSDQPSAPSGLSPSGGAAVTVAKPVLSYVFSDVSGDSSSLARSGIQIHTSPITTGTPEWSGEVVTEEPVIDLASTSFAGIPAGGSRWWRVRAQDGAGLWSSWSDWTQVARVALPSLTMTAPADGAIITSPTPVVRWSVSGGSQESYQVLVWDKDRRTRFYTSGRVASSTARAHTIPAGVMSRDDAKYRVEIRIWDPVRRAPQPGVPLFVQRDVTITWDRDGSLTPTTLAVVPTANQVGMELTWTRAEDPGRWVVMRDGEVVDVIESGPYLAGEWWLPLTDTTILTGDTALYSDRGWRWVDWGADPRRDHTWEVAPVVNDITGRGQQVTGRLEPIGVWLVRPQTGEQVQVTNDDVPSGWGMVEQSTSHLPLGARRPVLVTQGLGGYQGRTSGELTGLDHRGGPSAQEQRDTFLALKSRQGQTMRMVLADQNLPVTCWGMTVAPAPAGPHLRFAVSWEWAQVAEYDYEPEYL